MAATPAALRYLKDLYGMFGSWALAAAAYNMGENGLKNQIQLQQTRDYYNLYLPEETQRYIFRILAVKLILSDPKRYGFELNAEDIYPPLLYDQVQLDLGRDVAVLSIARAAGTYYKTIRDLNPQIRSPHLARGTHTLLLPPGAAQGFHRRLKEEMDTDTPADQASATAGRQVVTVQPGDSLAAIARRFNTTPAQLAAWNGLKVNSPIHPGQRLVATAP
jgi:LysM repeat protein